MYTFFSSQHINRSIPYEVRVVRLLFLSQYFRLYPFSFLLHNSLPIICSFYCFCLCRLMIKMSFALGRAYGIWDYDNICWLYLSGSFVTSLQMVYWQNISKSLYYILTDCLVWSVGFCVLKCSVLCLIYNINLAIFANR